MGGRLGRDEVAGCGVFQTGQCHVRRGFGMEERRTGTHQATRILHPSLARGQPDPHPVCIYIERETERGVYIYIYIYVCVCMCV